MSDIMSYIRSGRAVEDDPNGYMLDLEPWDEETARRIARSSGVELTPEHFEVLGFLREFYAEHGPSRHAREIARELDQAFHARGGNQYLYRLFPEGPVHQGMAIAGLPVPSDSVDPAFGNSI